jgi:hypothetical protein
MFVAAILAGCGTTESLKVESPKYLTFSMAPLPTGTSAADPAVSAQLDQTLRASIVEGLTSKGYSEVPPREGDFTVKVHTEYYNDIVGRFEQRSLSIGFYDSKNNLEIWRATRGRSSPYTLDADALRKGVLNMLASLPHATTL